MYKIGIIGGRDDVLAFMALGYTVFEAADPEAAKIALRSAVQSEEFAVLFIEESLALAIGEEIARYRDDPTPAITVLPGKNGSMGTGAAALKNAMERAVGADIL